MGDANNLLRAGGNGLKVTDISQGRKIVAQTFNSCLQLACSILGSGAEALHRPQCLSISKLDLLYLVLCFRVVSIRDRFKSTYLI